MDSTQKLSELRKKIHEHKLAGFLQPVGDEYMNEYPPACNRRVEWLSGFSGSAGAVAVLENKAAIFVDGRYTLQAKNEVGEDYEQHNIADITPEKWLAEKLKNARIGYDSRLFTLSMVKRIEKEFAKSALELIAVDNLIDAIWKNRPPAPASDIFIHEQKFAGISSADKRKLIAQEIARAGADSAVIASPDSVCWLLNIRARDVENTPLLLAPVIINSEGRAQLFVSQKRVNAEISAHLGNEVSLEEPSMLAASLQKIAKEKKRVLVDPHNTSVWYAEELGGAAIIEADDPCILPKAMKNSSELAGIKAAHIRDGQALIRLLAWIDREFAKRAITELDICNQLLALRKQVPEFVEPSFNTIAGSGPNGAIVHYRATKESNRALKSGELLLLDSGGQYPGGTTDITRTIAIGAPSAEQKDRFTRVLKGHIAIATAEFPEGTNGSQLDALARQYLWHAGVDYDHGTGHGVGCFLGVHEGPQRISKRAGDAALKAGMIISNEPGYYKTGEYGIRIENLVVTVTGKKGESKQFMSFETLSCVPIDVRLVEPSMLTAAEKQWLNDYHAWVLKTQLAGLSGEDAAWLKEACRAL